MLKHLIDTTRQFPIIISVSIFLYLGFRAILIATDLSTSSFIGIALLLVSIYLSIWLIISKFKVTKNFSSTDLWLSFYIFLSFSIFSFITAGEWMKINRDPGFIHSGGKLLSSNSLLGINISYFTSLPSDLNEIVGNGFYPGFTNRTPVQGFPGTHLVFSLSQIFGDESLIFFISPLVSSLALSIYFLICTLIFKSKLVSLATTSMIALSYPFLYTSRVTFSEPINLLLLLQALLFILIFARTKNFNLMYFILFAVSLAAFIRADGTLSVYIPIFILVACVLPTENFNSQFFRLSVITGFLMVATFTYLSFLFSPQYFRDLQFDILAQIVLVFLFALLIFFLSILSLKSKLKKFSPKFRQKFLAALALSPFLMLTVFTIRSLKDYPVTSIPPTSLSFLWYFGPPAAILSLLGVFNIFQNRSLSYRLKLWLLVTVNYTCVIYFWDPLIAPDQPWASRRLVLIAIPVFGFLVGFGILQAKHMLNSFIFLKRAWSQSLIYILVLIVSFNSAWIARAYIPQIEQKGQKQFVSKVCSQINVLDTGQMSLVMLDYELHAWAYTFNVECSRPVVFLNQGLSSIGPESSALLEFISSNSGTIDQRQIILVSATELVHGIEVRNEIHGASTDSVWGVPRVVSGFESAFIGIWDPSDSFIINERVPALRASEPIAFGSDAYESQAALVSGWSVPEKYGVWSIGNMANVAVQAVPFGAEPKAINLDLEPFLPSEESRLTFKVSINGLPVSTHTLTKKSEYPIRIPINESTLNSSDRYLLIELEIINPTAPSSTYASSDDRLLGLFLKTIFLS